MRSLVVKRVDTGIGDASAPPGTELWAQRWRLELYGAVERIRITPELTKSLVDIGKKYRAWTLLRDECNAPFKAFEDFCRAAQPYGLGHPVEQIKPYLVPAIMSETEWGLETVSPAQSPPGKITDTVSVMSNAKKRKAERLRAVLRAPAEIQDLRRAELISQKLAEQLGPKKPTEAQLEQQKQVVLALRDVPRDRKAIDAKVREVLGQKKEKDPVKEALRWVSKMNEEQRARFLKALGLRNVA